MTEIEFPKAVVHAAFNFSQAAPSPQKFKSTLEDQIERALQHGDVDGALRTSHSVLERIMNLPGGSAAVGKLREGTRANLPSLVQAGVLDAHVALLGWTDLDENSSAQTAQVAKRAAAALATHQHLENFQAARPTKDVRAMVTHLDAAWNSAGIGRIVRYFNVNQAYEEIKLDLESKLAKASAGPTPRPVMPAPRKVGLESPSSLAPASLEVIVPGTKKRRPSAKISRDGIDKKKPDKRAPAFPCNHCEKSFKRKEHRDRHMRGVNGERPFQCRLEYLGPDSMVRICAKWFSRFDNLKQHAQTVHGTVLVSSN